MYVFISFLLILFSFFFLPKVKNGTYDFIDKHYSKIVIALFIICFITSIYKLGIVPSGIHVDEAGMFYDAKLLAMFGHDRYLNSFPIYLINYGRGQSVMYAYLVAFLIKTFGCRMILMRIPSVLFRLLLFISAFFLIQNEKNKISRVLFLFLLTVTPYFIMQSRLGIDCNLLIDFMTISVSLLFNGIIYKKKSLLFLSGLFFGLSFYTYALSFLIIPLFLLIVFAYLFYIQKIHIKDFFLFSIPFIITVVPCCLLILVNNGFLSEIRSFITIPKIPLYGLGEISIKNILISSRILFAIFSFDLFGENLVYNSIPYFGTLYYLSIPFFILGFSSCIVEVKKHVKAKMFSLDFLIVIWFLSVLVCMFLISFPNINKANALFVPLVFFVMKGILIFEEKKSGILKLIFILYVAHFSLFSYYYYFKFNQDYDTRIYFATYYLDSLNYVKDLNQKVIYIDPDITKEPYIYLYLLNPIDSFNKKSITIQDKHYIIELPSSFDENTLFITKRDDLGSVIHKIGDINIIGYVGD